MPAAVGWCIVTLMVQAPWTYELPAAGSSAENFDDYEACTAEGAHAGVVTGLVERDGDLLYVLVDAGRLPPFVHRRLYREPHAGHRAYTTHQGAPGGAHAAPS